MTEFTKDEWVIDSGEKGDRSHLITTNDRSVINNIIPICEIETDFEGYIGVEQKANAHLIASSPDMYKMLDEICINMHKTESGSIEDILAIESLLKKARGE